MNKDELRIPLWVESPRGDDRIGTDPTGQIISDFEAKQKDIPFEQGLPQSQIQQAVEQQLEQDKWVHIEKKDGTAELLTKKDVPVKKGQQMVFGSGDDEPIVRVEPPKPPKPEPKPQEPISSCTPCSSTLPKKEREEWVSKFEDIKSATATHKGKGG